MLDLPYPPQRIDSAIAADVQIALLAALDGDELAPVTLQWIEKVRRFASYGGRNLRGVAKRRFGAAADAQLDWMIRFLLNGAARHPDKGAAALDPACLSAAFYCLDANGAGSLALEHLLGNAEAALRTSLLSVEQAPSPPALGELYDCATARWSDEAAACGPVVLFSPNPYSLLSIAVLELCVRYRVPVAAIVLRDFTLRRFAEEWSRDGLRLPRKIWRKLVLRADENAASGGLSLKSIVQDLRPAHTDIRKTARAQAIPLIQAERFTNLAGSLGRLGAELGLFTGGGLIDQNTIDCFSSGIINVHLGLLPHYKGMDVVEAPVLEGRASVGSTAHLMVRKLDAGPVLLRAEQDPSSYGSLGALRNSLGCMSPLMMFDSALGLCSGRITPVGQAETGRQFFIIHPRLRSILDEALEARAQKSSSARPRLEACVSRALAGLSQA